MRFRFCLAALLVIDLFLGCGSDFDAAFTDAEWHRLQSLTGLGPVPRDASNAYVDNPGAVELGRRFFSDPAFSGPATQVDALGREAATARAPRGERTGVSCATCHDLGRAGADATSIPGNVSAGAGWTDVNALAIVNSSYHDRMFWNGRADSQWALAVAVAESPTTMNGTRLQTAWAIADGYRNEYEAVFGPLPMAGTSADIPLSFPLSGKPGQPAWDNMNADDKRAITRVLVNWAKALAAYEATLVSRDSPFDQFVAEGRASTKISSAAKRGARLFVGKASCFDCHNTPLLSDRQFHDIGVPQAGPNVPTLADCPAGSAACDCSSGQKCLPWGAWDGTSKLSANTYRRDSQWSDDVVKQKQPPPQLPLTDDLKGAWRTPSLRSVALTAPYMHDGVYATLEEVVHHYSVGPSPEAVGTPAVNIKPLALSARESADLVEFLKTLTGDLAGQDGAGGTGGGGGAAGRSGGGPDAAPPDTAVAPGCLTSVPPTMRLISDFSTPMVSTYTYGMPGPLRIVVSGGVLRITLSVPAGATPTYFGAGLYLDAVPGANVCIDARSYMGISFTMSGSITGCSLNYATDDREHSVAGPDNPKASGPPGSFSPQIALTPGSPMTYMIPFAGPGAPTGGNPLSPIDTFKLTGVNWGFTVPAGPGTMCTADITIDDVMFY